MNRRGFFGTLAALAALPWVGRKRPDPRYFIGEHVSLVNDDVPDQLFCNDKPDLDVPDSGVILDSWYKLRGQTMFTYKRCRI